MSKHTHKDLRLILNLGRKKNSGNCGRLLAMRLEVCPVALLGLAMEAEEQNTETQTQNDEQTATQAGHVPPDRAT
jgi:hypothetical protein